MKKKKVGFQKARFEIGFEKGLIWVGGGVKSNNPPGLSKSWVRKGLIVAFCTFTAIEMNTPLMVLILDGNSELGAHTVIRPV